MEEGDEEWRADVRLPAWRMAWPFTHDWGLGAGEDEGISM